MNTLTTPVLFRQTKERGPFAAFPTMPGVHAGTIHCYRRAFPELTPIELDALARTRPATPDQIKTLLPHVEAHIASRGWPPMRLVRKATDEMREVRNTRELNRKGII